MLIRCDSQGDTIWTREFAISQDERARGITLDSDGNVLIVGYQSALGTEQAGFIRKVSLEGETIWRHIVSLPDTSIVFSDVLLHEQGYLLAGELDPSDDDSFGYLHLMGEEGVELWSDIYGGDERDIFFNACQHQGNLYFVGTSKSFTSDANKDHYVVRLNESLEVQWQETFGGSENEGGGSCTILENGEILITGYTQSYHPDGDWESYIYKIDSMGQVITSIDDLTSATPENHVYPNPIQAGLPLHIKLASAIDRIEIYTSQGSRILTQQVSSNLQGLHSITLPDHLAEGLYFISAVASDGSSSVLPFVLE